MPGRSGPLIASTEPVGRGPGRWVDLKLIRIRAFFVYNRFSIAYLVGLAYGLQRTKPGVVRGSCMWPPHAAIRRGRRLFAPPVRGIAMRPAAFEYHKAANIDDAIRLLAEFGEDGRPIAGGQSLVPMMNLRLARPGHLVDINALPMNDITFDDHVMRVGALVRHEQYARDPRVGAHFPALMDAVRWIGHPTIRRHGSIGGSLSHADPTAELPAAALLYDASIVTRSLSGERRIAAVDFLLSAYVTALEPGELVVAVEFPLPSRNSTGCFLEIAERHGDFATASVGVAIEFESENITRAALVCCGAELVAIRASDIEAHLVGRPLAAPDAAEAARRFAASVNPIGHHGASADYKCALIGELTRRAIDSACASALDRT